MTHTLLDAYQAPDQTPDHTPEPLQLYTINEVARILKSTRGRVYRLMREGQLPYSQMSPSSRRRVSNADIAALIRRTRVTCDQQPGRVTEDAGANK